MKYIFYNYYKSMINCSFQICKIEQEIYNRMKTMTEIDVKLLSNLPDAWL